MQIKYICVYIPFSVHIKVVLVWDPFDKFDWYLKSIVLSLVCLLSGCSLSKVVRSLKFDLMVPLLVLLQRLLLLLQKLLLLPLLLLFSWSWLLFTLLLVVGWFAKLDSSSSTDGFWLCEVVRLVCVTNSPSCSSLSIGSPFRLIISILTSTPWSFDATAW